MTTIDDRNASPEYQEFCTGFTRLTKIDLHQYKSRQMERRLRSFATTRNFASLADLLRAVSSSPDLKRELLDHMTINVSQLWRNPQQWEILAEKIIPKLAQEGMLRCWSAGCSYGAEAFTLAALIRETVGDLPGTRIYASDIDRTIVDRAAEGQFAELDARSAPEWLTQKWFDARGDQLFAKPELKSMIRFQVEDLLIDNRHENRFDLILCRNVVIYFTDEATRGVHQRLAKALRAGGILMVGSTERVRQRPDEIGLHMTHPFIYQKA